MNLYKHSPNMFRFQKNGLFGAGLSSTLISFDEKPPLKDIIYLNLHPFS